VALAVVETGVDEAGLAVDVVVVVEVTVDVGVAGAAEPETADWPPEELGEGETIATGVAPDEDPVAGADAEGDESVVAEVLVVNAVAAVNGSRVARASATFVAPWRDGAGRGPADADLATAGADVAAGGGGGAAAAPLVEPSFTSNIGTATRAAISSAITIHILRSIRSRRSALMGGLRWRRRPRPTRPTTDRSLRRAEPQGSATR
jgi:hypothetical protein